MEDDPGFGTFLGVANNDGTEKEGKKPAAESEALIDSAMIRKLVNEVLYNKGHPITCGDRLKVEL